MSFLPEILDAGTVKSQMLTRGEDRMLTAVKEEFHRVLDVGILDTDAMKTQLLSAGEVQLLSAGEVQRLTTGETQMLAAGEI